MQLHELIQSMSKAEKRHFKLHVQSNMGKGQYPRYLLLFDLLNRQEYYNEEKIVKKGFNYDDKSLLNEKILEALHVFHSGKSVDSELSIMLHQISILYHKSLWTALGKLVKKARKLATEHERFLSLLRVIRWEKIIADRWGKYDEYNLLIDEKKAIKNKLDEEMNCVELIEKVVITLNKDSSLTNAENRLKIEQIANELLMANYSDSSSIITRISYHRIKFRYYLHLKKDKKQACFHATQIVQLSENHDFVLLNEGVIGVYLISLFWQRELSDSPNEAPDFIKVIENLQLQSPHTIYAAYAFGLADCQRNLNQEGGELLIKKMEDEQYISKIKLHQQLSLFYNVLKFYSVFEKWKEAQIWLNRILAIKRPSVRKDIQIKARFWVLIVVYEQELEGLDRHIQSLQKYLKRANHHSEIQQHVIQAFNGLDQALRYEEKIVIWKELLTQLDKEVVETDIPVLALQLWCESRIKRTTTTEIIKQRKVTSS